MSWEVVKIGECCEITSSKRIFYSEYVDSGIPFYRSKEVIERSNGQTIEEPLYISQEKFESIKEKFGVPVAGDILLTSVGTIGVPYVVKADDCFYFKDGNLTWFRNFSKTMNSRYCYYWIRSDIGQSILYNSTIGSSQKALTISTLKNISIKIPPIETQNTIVDILTAYDDLIENNQKQIKLLEEAAQRLYQEWFVDLHFPGYEHTLIVDGVPEGWKTKSAQEFFDITIGKTPPRGEKQCFTRFPDGVKWVSIADMGKASAFVFETSESLTSEAIAQYGVKQIPANTVLLSFKLTVGRVSIATETMCTNEAIAHFRLPSDTLLPYVYCYLKNFHYDELGSTSSISKAVNSKIIKAMPFVMPSEDIVTAFANIVRPFFDMIREKSRAILRATEARDRLLPKLMSGEIIQ